MVSPCRRGVAVLPGRPCPWPSRGRSAASMIAHRVGTLDALSRRRVSPHRGHRPSLRQPRMTAAATSRPPSGKAVDGERSPHDRERQQGILDLARVDRRALDLEHVVAAADVEKIAVASSRPRSPVGYQPSTVNTSSRSRPQMPRIRFGPRSWISPISPGDRRAGIGINDTQLDAIKGAHSYRACSGERSRSSG